jgi:hypothetical protein
MQTASRTLLYTLAFILLTLPLASNAQSALQFVPITPCRVADTRPQHGGKGPIPGGTYETFLIQGSQGKCTDIPSSSAAYSLNVTVVPPGRLGYLTVWPDGEDQPKVSTMNSADGRVKANATVVGAGTTDSGAINVFASDTTNVVLDLDGYFEAIPTNDPVLAFYPLTPCRVLDTRKGQILQGGQQYTFPISGSCNVPTGATAYSLNFTALPPAPLGYLTAWPTGQTLPPASTLNAPTGAVTANAALLEAGTDGEINVFPSDNTNLLIDVNGYFAPSGFAPNGLSLFTLPPCRILDTRTDGGLFTGTISVDMLVDPCGLPSTARSVVVNATVLPPGRLGYLTLWANGQPMPTVSTLNAMDGVVTSNMAVVPTSNDFVDAFASDPTQLLVDLFDYFAIPSGLNGNYTFSINGYNTSTGGQPPSPSPCQGTPQGTVGPFSMVGSFVANGNGHVHGVLDLNCANLGAIQPLNVSFNGTYSIQPDGLGTMTITPTLNTPFHLSIAMSSTGNGRLVFNNEGTSYLPNAWGTGAITVQNPADLLPQQIVGNFASGFSGVDPSLNRYAGAGAYQIDQTQNVISSDAFANDNGRVVPILVEGALTSLDSITGRGSASLTVNGLGTHWVYYVTSANELTFLSSDPITSPAPLVLQTMLRQSKSTFDNTDLKGVGVVRTSGLSLTDRKKQRPQAGTTDVVLGLLTTDGAGNGSVSLDENNGGTLTQQQVNNGTYTVASDGLVTLTGFGNGTPPFFYLVDKNEAFVLGQDNSVASGFLVPQGGAPFSNATAIGTYWGGSHMPVTQDVTDSVTTAFADGNGNLNGTNVTSDKNGVGGGPFTGTYSVDATGRITLTENGSLAAILYVISPTRVALLPATDPNPSVAVLGSTN